MKDKNSNLVANRIVKAFLKNKIINTKKNQPYKWIKKNYFWNKLQIKNLLFF